MTILQNWQDTRNMPRPHPYYRGLFFSALQFYQPKSVLDVGCGDGVLLGKLVQNGIEAHGLEPDRELVATLSGRNFQVKQGVGENLPYADKSMDFVVCEFTAHHFEDLELFVREACRVARRGVMLLDQWYDRSIESSALAERFDLWCKKIDQRAGEIHFPTRTTGELQQMFQRLATERLSLTINTSLLLKLVATERLQEIIEAQRKKLLFNAELENELREIMETAKCVGMIDDGAVILSAIM